MSPFFSIIIPAYNIEKYISYAITSVINQNFQDFELIIINDCSIDNTLTIIEDFAKKNDRIKIINQSTNYTQHIARMDGLSIAKGKFIMFLDGDDTFTENAFNILYTFINNNPDYDYYEFSYRFIPSLSVSFPYQDNENRFLKFFDLINYPNHTIWNKVYRSELIKRAFFFMKRTRINQGVEDFYESVVIAYYSKNITTLNNIIINYSYGIGITNTYKSYEKVIEWLDSVNFMLDLVKEFLQNNNQKIEFNRIYLRYLDYVIIYYIYTQKSDVDKLRLIHILPNYFKVEIIMEYLNQKNISFFDLNHKYNSIYNSNEYKLGKLLLKPLRKLKNFIIKI